MKYKKEKYNKYVGPVSLYPTLCTGNYQQMKEHNHQQSLDATHQGNYKYCMLNVKQMCEHGCKDTEKSNHHQSRKKYRRNS
eukprot:1368836-Karenia_brevis.AAC.1